MKKRRKKSRKAQAAMEYLMTYGWAILIIIVVVAALYAMGVFSVGTSPVRCSPCFSYFAFVDYNEAGTAIIRNGAYTVKDLVVWPAAVTVTPDGSTTDIGPGETLTLSSIPQDQDVKVTIQYNVTTSGFPHNDSGTIHT